MRSHAQLFTVTHSHYSALSILHDNIHNWVRRDKLFWHLRPPFVVESVTRDLELILLQERDNAGRGPSEPLTAHIPNTEWIQYKQHPIAKALKVTEFLQVCFLNG